MKAAYRKNCEGKPFPVLVEMKGSGAESAIAIIRKKPEKKGMRYVSSVATLESEMDSGAVGDKIRDFAGTIGIVWRGVMPLS